MTVISFWLSLKDLSLNNLAEKCELLYFLCSSSFFVIFFKKMLDKSKLQV